MPVDLFDSIRQVGPAGFLRWIESCGCYVLFERQGDSFRAVLRGGYGGALFEYSFLEKSPEQLMGAIEKGVDMLEGVGQFMPGHRLWVVAEPEHAPVHLLVCELPREAMAHSDLLRLGLIQYAVGINRSSQARHLPPWMASPLAAMVEAPSPTLLQSEPGSGAELLVEAMLENRFGGVQAATFFQPVRLSEAVQLREMFGDPVSRRLDRGVASVPIARRKQVIVIQEVGALSRQAQLRVLAELSASETGRFWLMQTAMDLEAMAAEDAFVSGLYLRLARHIITVPPLRSQIQLLAGEAENILADLGRRYGRPLSLSADAVTALEDYNWPGNYREFCRTIEAAFLLAERDPIQASELRLGSWADSVEPDALNIRKQAQQLEKKLLLQAFALHAGNQVHMARALGISRGSLQYKLDKYGLIRNV